MWILLSVSFTIKIIVQHKIYLLTHLNSEHQENYYALLFIRMIHKSSEIITREEGYLDVVSQWPFFYKTGYLHLFTDIEYFVIIYLSSHMYIYLLHWKELLR